MKVAAGRLTRSFSIKTSPVAGIETAIIGASLGLKSITLSPKSVVGGSPASGAVKLECAAGPDPIVVTLSSSKPATAWPASDTVAIPVGVATAPFTLTTLPVAAVVKAVIKASANGVTKSKTLTVKAASSP